MIRLAAVVALAMLTGCVGSSEARNPLLAKAKSEKVWWRTPVYPDTKRKDNPWEKYVPEPKKVNELDPWANDDLQKYGVSPVLSAKTATKTRPYKLLKYEDVKKRALERRVKRRAEELKRRRAAERKLKEYLEKKQKEWLRKRRSRSI